MMPCRQVKVPALAPLSPLRAIAKTISSGIANLNNYRFALNQNPFYIEQMRYVLDTDIPVERTRAEIEKILQRYGATGFMYA